MLEEKCAAVVGVGRMGSNIARRLQDRGCRIAAVYDADPALAMQVAEELRVPAMGALAEVAESAPVVLTAVSDDAAMDRIYAEAGDSLLGGPAERLFINTATVSPSVHVETQRRAELRGSASLEACLLGTVPHARQGSLFVLVGGRESVFRRAEPLLGEIAAAVRYVGGAGDAAKVKAIINMVMNVNVAGLAEGLGLGEALGIDRELLLEALSKSAAASRALDTHARAMLEGRYGRFLTAEHAAKDAGIAIELVEQSGSHAPLARTMKQQYDRMVAQGLGKEDLAGIAEFTLRRRPADDRGER